MAPCEKVAATVFPLYCFHQTWSHRFWRKTWPVATRLCLPPHAPQNCRGEHGALRPGSVDGPSPPPTSCQPREQLREGGGEPRHSRARKFNKRLPRWRPRRLQLAEPTGKGESEATAPRSRPPGESRRRRRRPRSSAGGLSPLPRRGARPVFTHCPSDTGSGCRPRRRRRGPAAGPGRGQELERDLRPPAWTCRPRAGGHS